MSEQPPAQEPLPPEQPPEPEPAESAAPAESGEAAASAESAGVPPLPEAAPRPPRRRGRTALILAVAAVVGVLAGGGVGYKIQHDRPPTALPPLTGPELVRPKGAGPELAPLPVGQDRAAVYDGDLLKLLVPTPRTKGTKEAERKWLTLSDYASDFTKPEAVFTILAGNDFRRAAVATWVNTASRTVVDVELVQFRDQADAYASRWFGDQESYPATSAQYRSGVHIPGTVDGQVWGSGMPDSGSDVFPYSGGSLARVGNIVVDVEVNSEHPVAAKTVMSLIEQQLERL